MEPLCICEHKIKKKINENPNYNGGNSGNQKRRNRLVVKGYSQNYSSDQNRGKKGNFKS